MNGWAWLMPYNFHIPFKKATASLSKPLAPIHFVKGSQALSAVSIDSQLFFSLESLSPAQVAAICRLLYSSSWWPWAEHRLGLILACTRQPHSLRIQWTEQTLLEHHHLSPAQLILHGGWRLVVSGHSQSLQLIGLGKSLQ